MTEFKISNMKATDLAKEYDTPLYVYDEKKIIENIKRLNQAFSKYSNFKIHVAIKANNNIALLRIAREQGCGADCSNVNEIKVAKIVKFDDIIYSGNYQSIDNLRYGLENGVILNLDNADDLNELLNQKKPEIISFRLNPDFGNGKYDKIITGGKKAKFGSSKEKILAAYKLAKNSGIKRYGLHMMTGSCIMNEKYFSKIAEEIIETAGSLSKDLGIEFEFIDIGGGFGIPYSPNEKELDISKAANNIINALNNGIKKYGIKKPKLIIEPGRYIFGNAGYLVCKIVAIKFGREKYLGLNAGMNTLLRPALYGAYHHFIFASDVTAKPVEKVNFCGQICESSDIFLRNIRFPKTRIDDIIVIKDVGAYGFVMSSQYNTIPRPAEVLVNNGRAKLIREREDINDIIDGMLVE